LECIVIIKNNLTSW